MSEPQKPTIKIGDVCPNGKAKLIDITNTIVILGFGENHSTEVRVSFADCETLWGV